MQVSIAQTIWWVPACFQSLCPCTLGKKKKTKKQNTTQQAQQPNLSRPKSFHSEDTKNPRSITFFNRKKGTNCKFCRVTMRKISCLHQLSHNDLLQKYLCQEFQLHLHNNICTITSWRTLQHRLAIEWCSVDGLTCCYILYISIFCLLVKGKFVIRCGLTVNYWSCWVTASYYLNVIPITVHLQNTQQEGTMQRSNGT